MKRNVILVTLLFLMGCSPFLQIPDPDYQVLGEEDQKNIVEVEQSTDSLPDTHVDLSKSVDSKQVGFSSSINRPQLITEQTQPPLLEKSEENNDRGFQKTFPQYDTIPSSPSSLTSTTLPSTPAEYGINLLTNPSAESGVTGWFGGFTTKTSDPSPRTGSYYFFAGGNAVKTMYQTINLVEKGFYPRDLDNNYIKIFYGGYQRSYSGQGDYGRIEVAFLDTNQSELTRWIGPNISITTEWHLTQRSQLIPEGSRYVTYFFTSVRVDGSNNDGYLDDAFVQIIDPRMQSSVPDYQQPVIAFSNEEFDYLHTTYLWEGFGNESHPYIISNVTFEAFNDDSYQFWLQDIDYHILVRNCYFLSSSQGGRELFVVQNLTHLVVESNTYISGLKAVSIHNSSLDMADNIFQDQDVAFWGSGLPTGVFRNNTLRSSREGVRLEDSSYVWIEGNYFEGNEIGVTVNGSSNITLLNNNINGSLTNGLVLNNSLYINLTSNAFFNNTYKEIIGCNVGTARCGGLVFLRSQDIHISHNNLSFSYYRALTVDACKLVVVEANKLFNNSIGVWLTQLTNNTVVRDNYLTNNTEGITTDTGFSNAVVHNIIFDPVSANVACDPYTCLPTANFDRNFYSYWTTPDDNSDGIVDDPYQSGPVYDSHPIAIMGDKDSDYDGITDSYEHLYQTNPSSPDSDLDGLTDWEELYTYLSDPLLTDTDDDGLLDGEEVIIYQTSPIKNDTDDDLLPDHWEIQFNLDPTNAADSCSDTDADGLMATEEFNYGLDPTNQDTDFDNLIDGLEVYRYRTDPTNNDTDDDGMIDGDEVSIHLTNPLSNDTDGDGFTDNLELTYGTNPLIADEDEDGLSDELEVCYGTNSTMFDTDRDGLSDYQEAVVYFTDPLSSDTDSDGLNDADEVLLFLTNPCSNDTDSDRLSDFQEVIIHFTDPLSNDSDSDGLSDDLELMFLSDPWSNDTEGDGLTDLQEWLIASNPLLDDSDGDLLPDYWEFMNGLDLNRNDTYLDPDNDFLSNYDEMKFGSNPLRSDTENDGLDDGLELFYGTNPWSNDTDGDSISDYDELFLFGSDPTEPDSDFDGLSDLEELILGTNLTNIDSDNDTLTDWLEVDRGYNPLSNDTDNDSLTDGEEVNVWNTYPLSNDTDSDGLTDGMEVNVWNTDPLQSDSDGDGLTDGVEVNEWNTNPLQSDSDGDSLTDGSEIKFHFTNPKSNDTDGDGMPDGWEVYFNLNPNEDDSALDPDGDSLSSLEEYLQGSNPRAFDALPTTTQGSSVVDQNFNEARGAAAQGSGILALLLLILTGILSLQRKP